MAISENKIDEEIINSSIHGFGAVLSIFATILLIIYSSHRSAIEMTGAIVYGITLIMLYSASSVYHGAKNPDRKGKLEILDHACIYLLIAGTYTPFMLITLKGTLGFAILGLIWSLAIAGVIFKLFFYTQKLNFISTLLYLLMGWMIVLAIKPMIGHLSFYGVMWLIIGGLFYSLGTIFYLKDKKVRYFHAIWHLFVLAGSISHFLAIFLYVLPSNVIH